MIADTPVDDHTVRRVPGCAMWCYFVDESENEGEFDSNPDANTDLAITTLCKNKLHAARSLAFVARTLRTYVMTVSLPNLVELIIVDCGMEELSIGGQLPALQILNLAHNQLTSVPEVIWTFLHLKRLNLSGNRIVDLPPQMEGMRALEELDLSYNRLSTQCLPTVLMRMPGLRGLNVLNNWTDNNVQFG